MSQNNFKTHWFFCFKYRKFQWTQLARFKLSWLQHKGKNTVLSYILGQVHHEIDDLWTVTIAQEILKKRGLETKFKLCCFIYSLESPIVILGYSLQEFKLSTWDTCNRTLEVVSQFQVDISHIEVVKVLVEWREILKEPKNKTLHWEMQLVTGIITVRFSGIILVKMITFLSILTINISLNIWNKFDSQFS